MMKKYLCGFILFLFCCVYAVSAYGDDLELVIKENKCTDEGITIKYSIINHKNFDRPNITAAFKIVVDGEIVACEKITSTVPRGADGSDIKEILIKTQCKEKAAKIQSRLFTGMTSGVTKHNWEMSCP